MPRVRANHAGRFEGELMMCDAHDARLHRCTRLARFLSAAHPRVDLVPPLTDAQLVYANERLLIINGSETIDDRDYLQTWMLAQREADLHSIAAITRSGKGGGR